MHLNSIKRRLGRIVWWLGVGAIAGLVIWMLTGPTPADAARATCTIKQPLTSLPRMPEASGLALSRRTPGLLWSFNDSGAAVLYGLDTRGTTVATVQVTGARVNDWEDVSVGPCPSGSCVYLADIGDNSGTRSAVVFYRFAEPRLGDQSSATAEVFRAAYDDGPHDAESAFVTADGGLFVVTKDNPSILYRVRGPLRTNATLRLSRVMEIPVESPTGQRLRRARVTDAETSPDGQWVALRTAREVVIYPTAALTRGDAPSPTLVGLGDLREPQGEGVALDADGTLYVSGEGGTKSTPGSFASLSCGPWH
jgi:hypothetical protein